MPLPKNELDAFVAAWDAGDRDAVSRTAAELGVVFDEATIEKLSRLLERGNGRRDSFLLQIGDVLHAVEEAALGEAGIAVRHGGGEKLSPGKTTVCLAVKTDDARVVVGIGSCFADGPSPGRVWKSLSPWQKNLARNKQKLEEWVAEAAGDRAPVALTAAPAPKKSGESGASLLADVLRKPDDDEPRLVYADWLTAQGDPRGELITIQCEIAAAPGDEREQALVDRERVLLEQHGKAFGRDVSQVASLWEFRRGFVAEMTSTTSSFVNQGAALLEREPVEKLVVYKPSGSGLAALGGAAHLAKLRSITLYETFYIMNKKDVPNVRTFLASPHLGRLRSIDLSISLYRGGEGYEDLFDGISWPDVESLALRVELPKVNLAAMQLPRLKEMKVIGLATAKKEELRAAYPHATVT